ncbi:MAG: hypothetical protein HY917_02135, partial [Candidatus Diapherotrites archaeon]|nr:hypothetical protein [Candidatus Diapherotrites archaeon]
GQGYGGYPSGPQGGYGGGPPMQQQGSSMRGPGPSPEELCGMTDDEILESYLPMNNAGPDKEELKQRCRMEASRVISDMGRYKLEIARCKADMALDCQARLQAAQSCNEAKENPQKAAEFIVNSQCRRFAPVKETGKNQLTEVASKWYQEDPALANQLGDTGEKIKEEQKKLDLVSYLTGNQEYAAKLKDRAEKLRTIQQRLADKGVQDPETLSILETQANELEAEGNKFGNAFDLTRLGYIFRQ